MTHAKIRLRAEHPAIIYEKVMVPALFTPWAQCLVDQAAPQSGDTILDLACGTGIVARLAAPRVDERGRVIGVDRSLAMLAVARSASTNPAEISWLKGDASQLPFIERRIDQVLCQQGFQFILNRSAAFHEIQRVLLPGGTLTASVWKPLGHHPVYQILYAELARRLHTSIESVSAIFSFGNEDDLWKGLREASFQQVEIHTEIREARFADPTSFLEIILRGAAAAVPAYRQMDASSQSALIKSVSQAVDPQLSKYNQDGVLVFTMTAMVVSASR